MATPMAEEQHGSTNQAKQVNTNNARPKRKFGWVWLVILAAIAYGAWHYRGVFASSSTPGGKGGKNGPAAVPVGVAKATRGDIPVYLRNIGTVVAFNTVTVHTRVDGQLINVAYQEGQIVHAGDLLVELDPRPFQVQLEQAEGQLAHDEALLKDANIDLGRYTDLYAEGVIPKQQLDTQRATADEYEGAIKADQAAIDTAKLDLVYCKVTAPITGRVGLRLVDIGNIVHAADTTGVVIITQLQPISVIFGLPQDSLPDVYAKVRAGTDLPVDAFDKDGVTHLATGKLLTIDNEIDTTTDTYKLKAVFDNNDYRLFPNQFVEMRLQTGTDKALTIVPATAIQRGPHGTFVYAVQPDNTVTVRDVTEKITEGAQTGLTAGVQPGDTVVVDGQDKLQEGTKVDTHAQASQPPANATAPAAGSSPPAAATQH